ncbi:MAG: IS630 family transposase [Cyanosarcina radialis HA8281-LM2]|jgi:hypothetical protein|nr:IS630 family transposase [Cyanosarcina radialis HA8281-LM2]
MAKAELLSVVRRDPQVLGYAQSRWSLQAISDCCQWLHLTTKAGLSQLLERLGISYKRGRDYLHSPDRFYQEKCSQIELALLRAWYEPQRYVLVYLDEFGIYRQPTVAQDWEAVGDSQPLARRAYKSNTCYRGVGALNALTGQVTYLLRSEISVSVLCQLFALLRADYPTVEQIYVVEDNWPVHFHPQVLAQLSPQDFAYPPSLPSSWSQLQMPAPSAHPLPITLLNLPTYAPWLNPIEKLWRWLKQKVVHLHRLSDDWPTLKQRVGDFLDQFRQGSQDLLHYVGLLPK